MDEQDSTALFLLSDQAQKINQALVLWLGEKGNKSWSAGTRSKYAHNIRHFRAVLQSAGLDLEANRRTIQMAAQGWAAQRWRGDNGEPISNATYNQRIASLSSWYEFVIKRELVPNIERNLIKSLDRRKTDDYQGAQPLSAEDVQQTLESIDRSTQAGGRDYVLLSLGFSTGRRVSELAGLRVGDLTFSGTTQLRIFWRRTKGGKSTDTVTDRELIALLRGWLCSLYGSLKAAPKDAAVWPSYSNNHRGQPISSSAIADICFARLGTYETHTMRHSFTAAMKMSGASDEEVGKQLTHAPGSRATHKYIRRIEGQVNPHAAAIRAGFGITVREAHNIP